MSKLIHYSGPAGSILLPQGYTRLAYIESTGTLWVDTEWKPTSNMVAYIEYSHTESTIDTPLYGVRDSDTSNSYTCWSHPEEYSYGCSISNIHGGTNTLVTTTFHIGDKITLLSNKTSVKVNGVSKTRTAGGSTQVNNLVLMGLRNGTNIDSGKFAGKIYFARFWDGDTLVRDFVPVQKSDDTIGLLDLVNNTFYGNSGTGTFIAGPEISQGFPISEYCLVETHSAVTLTSDIIPCYRRSDGKPGKYTLSTNTFTEVLGIIGPSITFGWGEIMNGVVGFPQTSAYDSNIYYEPDGSAWIRVFHHNNPASNKFSSSDTFTTSFKKNDNMWWDMPKFNLITDNIYDIMVKYKTTSNAGEIKHRWVLYTNPMSGTFENTTYDKVIKSYYYGSTIMGNSYGGFYRDIYNHAYIVQNNNHKGNWYGAIGCWEDFFDGIPGPNGTTITSGYVDVYMRIPNYSAIPHNISTGDGRNGEKNSAFDRGYIKTQGLESLKTSNWTIACWLYPLATCIPGNGSAFLGLGSTINGALVVESYRYFSYNTSGYPRSSNLSLENNKWTHIAFVNNGNTIKYYKNGIYVNEINSTNIVDTGELWVGSRCFGKEASCRFLDIQVWDEIKNPAELM